MSLLGFARSLHTDPSFLISAVERFTEIFGRFAETRFRSVSFDPNCALKSP